LESAVLGSSVEFGENIMKKKKFNGYITVCLFVFIACFSGCSGKKDESRGFEPVSQAEAESFANQLIAKFKQGDKSPFFNVGTDVSTIAALCHFSGVEIPGIMKSPSEQECRAFADRSVATNHMFFDSLKSVKLVEVKEKHGTFCAVLDCKFDQSVKSPITNSKFPFTLLKKKSSGEIVVVGFGD
jgi:hypothetical protein